MFSNLLDNLENRLNSGMWFRRGLAVVAVYLSIKITSWGMAFATDALVTKADLVGTAGVIAAVGALPLGLLTILFNTYVKARSDDPKSTESSS